jgi:antirestriction protein ArdC
MFEGEQSEIVVFWKFIEVEDKETGEKKEIPFLKHSHVFNLQQCEGLKLPPLSQGPAPRNSDPIREAQAIVENMPNRPRLEIDDVPSAYYSPAEDYVHMTTRERCVSDERYYETMFHELTHSTGHKSRLDRMEGDTGWKRFGSTSYCNEELVAEMGAAMLCAEAGIFQDTLEDSAAYIASWLSRLHNDRTLVVKAAGRAEKSTNYILGQPALA